jgi:Flp pilus assembly protein TadG
MKTGTHERGQALILIVFALIVLFGITGLAVDGGMAYSDRRTAQNAADNAALAAALVYARGGNVTTTALASAKTNGFNNNGSTNSVSVSEVNSTHCPFNGDGKDITVQITSHLPTYFAPVIGIRQMTNTVRAVTRSCAPYVGPLFDGNAIVALTPHGTGFDAHGTPQWHITGGGIFSNSSDSTSATCGGNAGVTSPSLTVVGGTSLTCHTVNVGTSTQGASQYTYADYSSFLPRVPACNGTARQVNGIWETEKNPNGTDKDGSKVAFSGDMNFGPGLFCVTNNPGPYHGQIIGAGVTFYLMDPNFSMKFAGGGSSGGGGNGNGNGGGNSGGGSNMTATAPTAGEFAGILMYSLPQSCVDPLTQTQQIDLRGNGSGDVTGSIIVPCASVTMFGNSNSTGLHTQVIAYNVDTGGNADININYNANDGPQVNYPAWLTLLK